MTTKKPNAVKRMKVSAEETKQIPIIEERLLGRDKLFNQIFTAIMSFTKNNLELKRELSLYICGKPGTGKTFTVEKVIKEFGLRKKSIFSGIIQLNAMEMNTPNDIFKIICQNLTSKSELKSRSLEAKAYKSIADSKNFTLLVIDEFESLTSRFNKESVIKIFMMPKATNGKLILISISNQVGMPDLLMPQLDSRNCTPDVIVFPPYTKQELIEIIMQKLPGEKNTLALEYCARQVEKFGDVRQALDICKNSMQDGKIELKSTIRTATNWNTNLNELKNLPQLQKSAIVLCKRICQDLFEKRPNKGVTTSQLHGAYARSMGLKGGEGLPFPEFAEMIQNLSSFGFTKLEGKTQDIGKKTIGIPVAWDELEKAFEDVPEVLEFKDGHVYSSWKNNV